MSPAAATAGLGVVLALAGAAFASPSLVVPGLALAGLALVAVGWTELAAQGAEVLARRGPGRIVEGDTYPLRVELRRGSVPPPGGEFDDPLLDSPVTVGPLRPRRLNVDLRMVRRGRHAVGGGTWTIRDPLGLHSRQVAGPPAGELLVLPRIEPVQAAGVGVAGMGSGATSTGEEGASSVREAQAVEFDVDGLRPYREGSPASRIHWPAVARSGEMYERRMVAGAEAVPLVVLDAEYPDDADSLDRAVRAAASLCVHLAPATGCALLLPGHRNPTALDQRLRAWPALHAHLAVVAAGVPTVSPGRVARRGSVFWVTGGAPSRAFALARSFGPGPHYVVTARTPGNGRVAFQVAGCSAVPLGRQRRQGPRRVAA
jgi:uncharacterized protein (DUF58 family)